MSVSLAARLRRRVPAAPHRPRQPEVRLPRLRRGLRGRQMRFRRGVHRARRLLPRAGVPLLGRHAHAPRVRAVDGDRVRLLPDRRGDRRSATRASTSAATSSSSTSARTAPSSSSPHDANVIKLYCESACVLHEGQPAALRHRGRRLRLLHARGHRRRDGRRLSAPARPCASCSSCGPRSTATPASRRKRACCSAACAGARASTCEGLLQSSGHVLAPGLPRAAAAAPCARRPPAEPPVARRGLAASRSVTNRAPAPPR